MTRLTAIPEGDWLLAGNAAAGRSGGFNEAFDVDGRPRPHWKTLLDSISGLGAEEFALRAENGRRILREHGVSQSRSQDGDSAVRGWDLDFLPLVIAAEEWRHLASGLAQRARLLNAILTDLHSVQRLVRDGFVPAPLIYANPGYLRACQALPVPGTNYLHVYAADLGRLPDGSWRVLADRTQAPTGLGFGHEARTVSARVLPEAIQDVHPHALTNPWRIRRDTFRLLAPQNPDNPTVVVLTPGAGSQAYFEDAFIGRLLGFTLVEGDDLSVRDRCVFIKTLDGLKRVDVILRRINDSYCDPLELRADSVLGVPGLVEATRSRRVALANALGSGLLESPAFLPFLPALCRHLLDEELRLPSIPTWWCGQRRESSYVRARAQELMIRPAFGFSHPPQNSDPKILAEQMRARAHEWVGQEPLQLSQAPIFINGRWETRSIVLRVLVIHDGESYVVLPGGLARIVTDPNPASVPFSCGGLCKDVWVLQEEQAETGAIHQLPVILAPVIERSPSDLPSRTADNLFWLGRYAERLEHLARVERCAVNRLSDETGPGSHRRLAALASLMVALGFDDAADSKTFSRQGLQERVFTLLYNDDESGGVRDLLRRMRTGAISLRHRLSADTSGILSRLGGAAPRRPGHLPLVHAAGLLNTLIVDLAALSGMEMENVTRGHGWVFLDLGRRIERALNLAQLAEAVVLQVDQLELLFESVLEIADSVMTYRWRYYGLPRLDGIMDLLVMEPLNPRSFTFQVARIGEHAANLPAAVNPEGVKDVRHRAAALASRLAGLDEATLSDSCHRAVSLELLASFAREIRDLSVLLTHVYFSHVKPRLAQDEIAAV